ncbi:MAG: YbeD family protein [Pseudohongiellaceae bacterium]
MTSNSPPNDQEAPKIEFPCLYPIKIIGVANSGFKESALKIVESHAGAVDENRVEVNPSKGNNYVSIRVTINATGIEQIQKLFEALKTLPETKMVL